MASATFLGPGGSDPRASIINFQTAFQPTVGDGLWGGQVGRSRILERTARGVDVNGVAFAPYADSHPFYFYPNRGMGASKQARATAAKGRYAKTGKAGKRTPLGIRYDSYAAAKASHGRGGVDLFGMEQHPHMLNAMIVKVGGMESSDALSALGPDDAEMSAFEQNQPNSEIRIGFYGEEADRARGNNEGIAKTKLPQRNFFALNQDDLDTIGNGIVRRMITRARAGR